MKFYNMHTEIAIASAILIKNVCMFRYVDKRMVVLYLVA